MIKFQTLLKRLIALIILTSITYSLPAQKKQESIEDFNSLNYLFKSGEEGYNCFRIPAVVATNKGSLIAFAEARKSSCSDTGDIDLVMRRSEDQGKTWSALQVVWDDKNNVCGNPAPIVDRITGKILLLSTWNLGEDKEHAIIKGTSKDTRRVFLLKSNDDGYNWSFPEEITKDVKLSGWSWYATGPGSGIQVEGGDYKGRLIVASDHIEKGTNKYYSHIIFSDDHGESWNLGGRTPMDKVNECEVVELSDNRLMLNMRNYDRSQSLRQIAYSSNGGYTWDNMQYSDELIEPICQASILRFDANNKTYLLFSNPAHKSKRENMAIKVSYDDGNTWPTSRTIFKGPSAYSDLVAFDGRIGLYFEAGKEGPYEGIVWESFDAHDLINMNGTKP